MDKMVGTAVLIAIFALLGLWISGEGAGERVIAANAAPSVSNPPVQRGPPSLQDQVIEQGPVAMQTVRESLIDPQSAVFRNVWAVRYGQEGEIPVMLFCGEVNGRNRFGGYAGYQPFLALGRSVYTPETSKVFAGMFEDHCVNGEFVANYSPG